MVDSPLLTPLYHWHQAQGAKLVPFAGWQMPLQYAGIVAEHLHTRSQASLFDVSHMGQLLLTGQGADRALERLLPGDIVGLAEGRMRYSLLTLSNGGILDDLMVVRLPSQEAESRLHLVINAARRQVDEAHLRAHLPHDLQLEALNSRALLALQGPTAAAVLAPLSPKAIDLPFMGAAELMVGDIPCLVMRSGYTGEDGFELSCAADDAVALADLLIAQDGVLPAGLGARDSLRLEAGLCLYGHDIDEQTNPVEAGLVWTIAKHRRDDSQGFLGAAAVLSALKNKAAADARQRVGLTLTAGSPPAREGAVIENLAGQAIGVVTSGGFSPSLQLPIAMGYVPADVIEGDVQVVVRGNRYLAKLSPLPFVPTRYVKPNATKP
jgi:aminomethyltransferase